MNPELVKELFQKYLYGTCTPEEMRLLEEAFMAYAQAQDVLPDETQIKAASEKVRDHLDFHVRRDRLRKRRRTISYYIAAAVLTISMSIGFITWRLAGDDHQRGDSWAVNDVPPGGNKATLTLADGRTVNLNEAHQGIVVGEEITYVDGTPVLKGQPAENEQRKTNYLTLNTPKGGTYQVTLPDGTNVWLNANTVLRYPDQFAADERVVEIEGEAYFDVTKDKNRPFKVRSTGQELVVLGTAFNISAYPDEIETETTLVEGAVEIANLTNKKISRLRPGQQALVTGEGVQVHEVDTEEFTAWKDGYFLYNDANIYTILKQFSRWYDIEIDDSIKPTGDLFTGKIPRNLSLKNALKIVERTSGMSFHLTDNKLVLSK